jgi:adenine-specific DNA-methyltransferase
MKNRLEVAREFLTTDGCLIIAIDENEQAHLGVLLKEMFRDYEIHCITIVHNPRGIQGTNFSYTHEYAFFVIPRGQKSIGHRRIVEADIDFRNLRDNGGESLRTDARTCFYPIIVEDGKVVGFGDVADASVHPDRNVKIGPKTHVYPIDPQGIERKWRYSRESVENIKDLLRAKEVRGFIDVELGKDFGTYRTVWEDARYDANEYGSKLLRDLVPGSSFLFPKSLWNVFDCIYAVVGNDPSAIVMDFFGGSGTTAHAVLELNKEDGGERRFILCEQMDYVETVTKARIREVIKRNGKDSFVYAELSVANEEFVQMIKGANTIDELQIIWNEMQDRAFLSYRANSVIDSISEISLTTLEKKDFKTFLLEILDHNMLYVPYSEIEDEQFSIDRKTQNINKNMFG